MLIRLFACFLPRYRSQLLLRLVLVLFIAHQVYCQAAHIYLMYLFLLRGLLQFIQFLHSLHRLKKNNSTAAQSGGSAEVM